MDDSLDKIKSLVVSVQQIVGPLTEYTRKIEKLNNVLSAGFVDAQKLDFAARQSGVSSGAIAEAVKSCGGSENFERTVTVLQEISAPYERIAAAQKVFGEQTQALLPLIFSEKGSLKQIEDTFDNMDIALSQESFAALSEINSQMATFASVFNSVLANFTTQLLPAFKLFSQYLEQNSQGIQMFAQFAGSAANLILKCLLGVAGWISSVSGAIGTLIGKVLSIGTTLQTVFLNLQTGFWNASNFIRQNWGALCGSLCDGILKAVEVIVFALNPLLGTIKGIVDAVHSISGGPDGGVAAVVKNTVSGSAGGNVFNRNSSRAVHTTNNSATTNNYFSGNISLSGSDSLNAILAGGQNVPLFAN